MAETIFINYRGGDSIGIPGRLHDRLTRVFGQKNVFMDDSMLNSQLAVCDVVLVVIGPNWLRRTKLANAGSTIQTTSSWSE